MNSNFPLDMSLNDFGSVKSPESPAAPANNEPQQPPRQQRSAQNKRDAGSAPRRKPTPSQSPQAPKKPAGQPTLNPLLEYFRSPRFRTTLGVIFTVLSALWLIISINFMKTGSLDQSLVADKGIMAIADSGQTIENAAGAFGAKIAHLLIIDGLGIGSFVLVIYFAVLALVNYGIMRCKFWSFTFKCLFTAVSLSVIFGLFTYNADTVFHWGGNHGRYVNQWLFHVSDSVGAYAVSMTLIALLVVMYISQLLAFYNSATGKIKKAREAMADAAARERVTPKELADLPADTASAQLSTEPETELPENLQNEPAVASPTPQVSAEPAPAAPATVGFSIDDDDTDLPVTNISPKSQAAKSDTELEFSITTSNLGEAPAAGSGELTIDEASEEPTDSQAPFDIRDELSRYRFPGTDLLVDRPVNTTVDKQEQEDNKDLIVKTLRSYGIEIARIHATIGPTVTLYEIVPAEGVRITQIKRLEDDIALSLAALGIRIIAPIPGKHTIGIEVPNREPQTVSMFSVISSSKFRDCKKTLPLALGSTINNDVFIEDLAEMPHLLVAGATGQGKSVGLNCIIASLLYKKHPGELKFVLIDPKRVEFSLYNNLEHHFLAKLPDDDKAIVTEPSKALSVLQSLCIEMDARYDLLESAEVRSIKEYNRKFSARRLNPEKGHRFLPYIVVIVDEFADLIMTAGKDISIHIARIAQKARAVGIHMIIATQRPSTDIITGMIKANFPARIAFKVAQSTDSKVILDRPGANRLVGRGDMIYSNNSKFERVQCAFIDTDEVSGLVSFINNQIGYETAYQLPEVMPEGAVAPGAVDLSKRDDMFDDCARFVVQNPTASTSSLQRRFAIGYNKAGKIMDQLEAAGIVGPADGQRPRSVLVDQIMLEDILRSL